ncbi:MAG: hypothetical protein E7481_08655 [Ruminococcaceae bacterium]|nr:hypothetical protein [Oscillospiraceae bacterium]
MNKKSLTVCAVLLAVVILLILTKIYTIPIEINTEKPICSLNGDVKTVELNLIWQRYLLRGSEVQGSITVDGKEYRSIYGSFKDNGVFRRDTEPPSFWEGLKDKITGNHYYRHVFFESADYLEGNSDSWDFLSVEFSNTDFNEICVWINALNEADENIGFYGPASTTDEAYNIMKILQQESNK